MTLDDAEMFCRAYVNGINQQQTWLIDWYVNLHQSFSSEHEQFFQQFQHSLENNIISNTSPSNPVKDELSKFLRPQTPSTNSSNDSSLFVRAMGRINQFFGYVSANC